MKDVFGLETADDIPLSNTMLGSSAIAQIHASYPLSLFATPAHTGVASIQATTIDYYTDRNLYLFEML